MHFVNLGFFISCSNDLLSNDDVVNVIIYCDCEIDLVVIYVGNRMVEIGD